MEKHEAEAFSRTAAPGAHILFNVNEHIQRPRRLREIAVTRSLQALRDAVADEIKLKFETGVSPHGSGVQVTNTGRHASLRTPHRVPVRLRFPILP